MGYVVSKNNEPRIVRNWPVVICVAEDGGKIRKEEITVDYEVLAQSEVDDILAAAQSAGQSGDKALLMRTVRSINGQVDTNNNPIPFDEDELNAACERSNQRVAMVNAFFDVQAGRKPARKNS